MFLGPVGSLLSGHYTAEREKERGSLIDLDTRLETLTLSNKAGTGEAKARQ